MTLRFYQNVRIGGKSQNCENHRITRFTHLKKNSNGFSGKNHGIILGYNLDNIGIHG